jgi:hypothetical protein
MCIFKNDTSVTKRGLIIPFGLSNIRKGKKEEKTVACYPYGSSSGIGKIIRTHDVIAIIRE